MTSKINSLKNGQSVTYRLGHAGAEDVNWGPWKTGSLHVQRNKKGKVVILCIKEELAWAEYTPEDYSERYDVFLVEDYYMQIKWPEGSE